MWKLVAVFLSFTIAYLAVSPLFSLMFARERSVTEYLVSGVVFGLIVVLLQLWKPATFGLTEPEQPVETK